MHTDKRIYVYELLFPLVAVLGLTVACSDRQDGVVAASAVGAQHWYAERLRLHSSTTHTVLLHSCTLQGVHGFAATFALGDRERDGRVHKRITAMISLNFPSLQNIFM